MRVGFFDSGVGGITVLSEAMNMLPDLNYLYYADTANVPYGVKDRETVRQYIFSAVEFIASQGVDALVVACNTATSIAIDDLRRKYDFPILGMEPAVKPAVEKSDGKRVLVLATSLTLRESKFQKLTGRVDIKHIVDPLPLPGLVEFAEKFVFDEEAVMPYLKNEFSRYDMNRYGAVVLGCTHFLFYKNIIRKLLPEETAIIDGNRGTVNHLKDVLKSRGYDSTPGKGEVCFYSSLKDVPEGQRLQRYLNVINNLQG